MMGSLFNKVAGLNVCSFFKNRLQHRCFLVDIAKFLRIAFLYNTSGGCFWVLPRYSKVSWGACSRLHGFSILIKNFHEKCCTNNSLLSRDKKISYLLELIGYVLLISEYVFKKTLTAFEILMKNLHTKRCTSNHVISRVKRLSSLALCGWSGAFSFRV